MSAPVTKEHCALWNKLYNLAFNECFGGDSSDAQATQLIADSEARACDQLRAEVADQVARFHEEIARRQQVVQDNKALDLQERDQLRAEVERLKDQGRTAGALFDDLKAMQARAERAELRVKQLEETK